MLTKVEVLAALEAAWKVPAVVKSGPTGGCGRAYVCVSADRVTVNAVAAACRKLGLTFLRKNYGAGGNALYCGYDNADGRALAKAEAVATSLKAAGLDCYVDAASD
jgi:hypothetical protein